MATPRETREPAPAAGGEGGLQRLFVSVEPPPEVVAGIRAIQAEWQRQHLLRGRFTAPENLHLTLKFLGERPRAQVPEIRRRLESVRFAPFTARIGELGVFDPRREIRILWLHVAGAEVPALQRAVDRALSDLFPPERRFMSHLTIARISGVPNRERLLQEIARMSVPALAFTVGAFTLKESRLGPQGPSYRVMAEYPAQT